MAKKLDTYLGIFSTRNEWFLHEQEVAPEVTPSTVLKELMDVRLAITEQQTKISELIRQRPPAIHLLPNEILACIFSIVFRADPRPLGRPTCCGITPVERRHYGEPNALVIYRFIPRRKA